MASWGEIETAEPEFAARVRAFMDAHVHKTIATLRRDGSPRISGIEARFHDGEIWVGSMPGAVKARDLQRDPRYALHSGSEDPPGWSGDAKVSGRAEEITAEPRRTEVFRAMTGDEEPSADSHLFRLDVSEAAVVALNESRDRLVIESWREGRGLERFERD